MLNLHQLKDRFLYIDLNSHGSIDTGRLYPGRHKNDWMAMADRLKQKGML